jgi:hypothetical protein
MAICNASVPELTETQCAAPASSGASGWSVTAAGTRRV